MPAKATFGGAGEERRFAGLVILIPNAPPTQQRALFDAVLDDLAAGPGLINEALEVRVVEGEIEITRYELAGAYRR